jgi:TonB family protein
MANVKVPLKFSIYRGDELVREEASSESVIKVGKLASSHLRLDDDSVSRMHAVIEVGGPDDVQLIDLGSTRGTLVNGEKITKARLRPGDEVYFGDVRVIVGFVEDEAMAELKEDATVVAPHVAAAAAAQPAARPAFGAPAAPPPAAVPAPFAPPPPAYAANPTPPRPTAGGAGYGAPPPGYGAPPPSAGYGAPPPGAAYGAPPAFAPPSANPVSAEVESHDGARAIEVQALYRGVVTNTRHLYDAGVKATSNKARAMLLGGVAATMLGLIVFLVTVFDVGKEKHLYEAHLNANKEAKTFQFKRRSPAPDVVVFLGWGIGMVLIYMGLKRRGVKQHDFVIGSDAHVDAPAAPEFIGGGSHHLVSIVGNDFQVNVTPQMSGDVAIDGQAYALQSFVQQRGPSFTLPEGGRARLLCGDATFLVSSTPKPRLLEVPFLIWKWNEQVYTVGAAVGLLLFLGIIFSVPPDPKSLSLDLFNSDNRFVNFLIKPPEEKEEEIPEWLKKKGPDEQGGKGKRHKGEEGKMGKKTSKNKEGLYGLKGPKDNPDPHLAKKLAEEEIKNAGILGVLKMTEGSHIASIFGRDTALGSDAENVLGGLIGTQIGESYGVGGLGLVGTGAGGGGTGEGTIGLGNLGTIGKGGGGGSGSGYGRGAGGLGGRRAKAPEVMPGQANVRGSLDKEIIRRIIRRHINEVKYCYEQELTRKADLGGRVAVTFTIAATGQVVTSVVQNSTLGNARVENCVVQAVRRWEFPKPLGGGIVIVTYPFQFTPAGGGGE